MFHTIYGLVPIATSSAGLCLTERNWREARVTCLSYSLDSLLLKPGIGFLKQLSNLKSYVSWSGSLILNAMNLVKNKADDYVLVSPYDGSKVSFSMIELVDLIQHLRPDAVLLPEKLVNEYPALWDKWPQEIVPLISLNDLNGFELNRPYGIYINLKEPRTSDILISQLKQWPGVPCYIAGNIPPVLLKELLNQNCVWIESNEPAEAAMTAKVFFDNKLIDLADKSHEFSFDPIDSDCPCPTCLQKFTKAYLHHLFLNTPLLCQRLLMQHNMVAIASKSLAKSVQ